jgi:hypothetical protein
MRGSGNIVCEDSFDSLVLFSDVWWIGTKEESPEEVQLDFPKKLKQEKHAEFDFKGGAGTVADRKSVSAVKIPPKECDEALTHNYRDFCAWIQIKLYTLLEIRIYL